MTPTPVNRLGLLTLVLGVVVIALLAGGSVLAVQAVRGNDKQDRYDAALAAARAETVAFTTIDYKNLEPDINRVLAGATGDFKKQFTSSKEQLTQLATQNQSTSSGRVLSAGVVSMDHDSARVIVVADSKVTNVSAPTPQPRHYRLQLDLVRQGDRWLTSDLQFVG